MINESAQKGASKEACCSVVDLSLRTFQRWCKNKDGDKRKGPKTNAKKLSIEEKEQIMKIANSKEYCNLSPRQIVPKLSDLGEYYASESSFYRVLKENHLLSHRQKSKPKKRYKEKEVMLADEINKLWSWDITYLKTGVVGQFYYLYMIMDLFSRKIVGAEVFEKESSDYGSFLINKTCKKEGIYGRKLTLHSDNGSPMKGSTMLATLQNLGVAPTYSRPSVSNDNPFSEALFKTLKYCPAFPEHPFSSIDQARNWTEKFVEWYNTKHLHSEINYVTPEQKHLGQHEEILTNRKKVYEEARSKNPQRWSKSIRNWFDERMPTLRNFRLIEI